MDRPFEVDPTEYPFTDRWLPYRDGYMHYLDEGQGPAVLPCTVTLRGLIFTGT
ncbi:haloalkane dehalogenase [compost metagenome]